MGKVISIRSVSTIDGPDIITQRELQNLADLRGSLLFQARITRDRERELRHRLLAGGKIQPGSFEGRLAEGIGSW